VVIVKKYRLLGGIFLLIAAALIFLISETINSIPLAVTLTIVGVALIATSRRVNQI
jgi:hypothetical protein